MEKSKQYGLEFITIKSDRFRPRPIIKSADHTTFEMSSFLKDCGPRYTQEMIDEFNSLHWKFTEPYDIYSQNEYDTVDLFPDPCRAAFWNGSAGSGYFEIPILDFIEILKEWIDFLNGIPFEHRLSSR